LRRAQLWVELAGSWVGITVAETTKRRQRSSQHILTAMILQDLAVIVVTLFAVFIGVRQGLQPLGDLEREIANRSADDLREIELDAAPAELRSLLGRLNQLFALLREAAQKQQRFIGDAAHQLRTPLAGLQTQLDLIAGERMFLDHPDRLAAIDEATTRIGHLLTQLLAYAKAEGSGPGAGPVESVALDQVVEKSATEFIDAALAKDIDLGFEIRATVVQGHQWLLQEALANLIDNAIRYTPPQGVVTVRCGEADGHPFLEVEDSGPGIPEEQREQVLERFYRIPGSPGNGCGLGLSIVSEIAKVHHGALQFGQGAACRGLRVRLSF
jgi:two-component system sensor histidine kinase TctE